MSSASLAVPRHTHPDAARIAALSGAIAINLVALVAVLRPMAPQWVEQVQKLTQTQVRWITPPPKVPDPPVIKMQKFALPKSVPHTQPAPPVTPPVVTPNDAGTIEAPPAAPPADSAGGPTTSTAPIEATLAYRAVPLSYPAQALRARMQGTVVLRVLVDEQGVPQEVRVEQSSGYTLLDRSAHDQVLHGWKFQPAMLNGRAVRSWARVPVTFNLNEL